MSSFPSWPRWAPLCRAERRRSLQPGVVLWVCSGAPRLRVYATPHGFAMPGRRVNRRTQRTVSAHFETWK
ncbi:hypothetical protein [Actinomyces sp. 432]|uniref:hypothetical protein n=1 Tax=Actinomyces sp. 432 TaxID=2057798 RepID=UPI001379619E|nr:hypothetical protein [Actinomyces sp. 432]